MGGSVILVTLIVAWLLLPDGLSISELLISWDSDKQALEFP